MLQKIRDRAQGLFAWVVVLLIVGIFIFLGMENFFQSGAEGVVAKVNGEAVSLSTVRDQAERLLKSQGQPQLAKEELDYLQSQIVNHLVQGLALEQGARGLGLAVSDQDLAAAIRRIPDFQEEGVFSEARYQQVLRQAYYHERGFEDEVRRSLLLNQLQLGIIQSEFSLPYELKTMVSLADQKRDIGSAVFSIDRFKLGLSVPEDAIEAYYQSHQKSFQSEEEIQIEYVLLSAPIVGDEKSEHAFSEQVERLSTLAFESSNLDAIVTELSLAKKTSDWVSKSGDMEKKGGILNNPVILSAAFEEDVLKHGHNSEVIDLSDGSALVLRVVGHKPSEQKSLEAVRDEIVFVLKTERAMALAQQKADEMIHELQAGKKADTAIAKAYGVEWRVDESLTRQSLGEQDEMVRYAFELPRPSVGHPALTQRVTQSGDVLLIKVLKVVDGEMGSLSAEQQTLFAQGLAQNFGELDFGLYVEQLLSKARIHIYKN